MMSEQPAGGGNTISGGNQYGPVLQGRDFRDVNIDVMVRAATAAPFALAQLPAPTAGFTGRGDELMVLARLLDPAGTGEPVVVSAVAGLAGVGKTTLAVHAGHAAVRAGWFAGGVLFLDLHGYDQIPVEPAQALDGLLRALGVPAEHIPPGAEERAGLYRSVLAQAPGPVLVVADNASAEAQVRPLLPGAGPHKVLVTSRHTLASLDARLVDVTTLDDQASVDLLDTALRAARPGDDRITGSREAASRLAEACGGLPLALQITAALLKADPALSAAELAGELAAESQRLKRLAYADGSGTGVSSVTAAFGLSYSRLDATAARVFRLLPLNPGPDISTAAAGMLADLPVADARSVLGGLARAHLAETAPGPGGRWRMHDLVRLYARQLSDAHADAAGLEQARDRLLGWYQSVAAAADKHLRALPGMTVPEEFAGRDDALAWLDAERTSLVAAVGMAGEAGRDEITIRLPHALGMYLNWRRRFDDWVAISTVGLATARRLSDRHRVGTVLINLGGALVEAGRSSEAILALQEAATILNETSDRNAEAMARDNLGSALQRERRFDEAITAHEDAVTLFQEIEDRNAEGMARDNLGNAFREIGRLEEAVTAHQEAVTIFQETGDRNAEGLALDNLGCTLRVTGRFEEAVIAHQDAVHIFRETDDRYDEGMTLDNLGVALREIGRFGEAIAAHQDATRIFRELGDEHDEGIALENLERARAARES